MPPVFSPASLGDAAADITRCENQRLNAVAQPNFNGRSTSQNRIRRF
jgi:hypothetical protein